MVDPAAPRVVERGFEFYRDQRGAYWRREVVKSTVGDGEVQTSHGNWHPYVDSPNPPTIRPRTGLGTGLAGEPTEENYDTVTRRVGWAMIVFALAVGVWLALVALHPHW